MPWERWLLAFPSYGFLLSVEPHHAARVRATFAARGIAAATIGQVRADRRLTLTAGADAIHLWDLAETPLTGFSSAREAA